MSLERRVAFSRYLSRLDPALAVELRYRTVSATRPAVGRSRPRFIRDAPRSRRSTARRTPALNRLVRRDFSRPCVLTFRGRSLSEPLSVPIQSPAGIRPSFAWCSPQAAKLASTADQFFQPTYVGYATTPTHRATVRPSLPRA